MNNSFEKSNKLRNELNEQLKQDIESRLKENSVAEFTVTSLGNYCDTVEFITQLWRKTAAKRQIDSHNPAPFNCGELSPWFRGVSNEKYTCEPTLFRFHKESLSDFRGLERTPTIYDTEDYFFQRFKAYGLPYLGRWAGNWVPSNDLEWHFLMRHYEVPSRFLDWSKGSFIALYFATRKSLEKEGDRDSQPSHSAVWMLEPRRLAEICNHKRNIYKANRQKFEDAYEKYFLTDECLQDDSQAHESLEKMRDLYPLPIIPDLISPRIAAHIGRFALHTFEENGIKKFADDSYDRDKISYLVKIRIPASNHFSICRSLRSTGVSDMNFTQDLDGLTKELSLRVNLGRKDHNIFARQIIEGGPDS